MRIFSNLTFFLILLFASYSYANQQKCLSTLAGKELGSVLDEHHPMIAKIKKSVDQAILLDEQGNEHSIQSLKACATGKKCALAFPRTSLLGAMNISGSLELIPQENGFFSASFVLKRQTGLSGADILTYEMDTLISKIILTTREISESGTDISDINILFHRHDWLKLDYILSEGRTGLDEGIQHLKNLGFSRAYNLRKSRLISYGVNVVLWSMAVSAIVVDGLLLGAPIAMTPGLLAAYMTVNSIWERDYQIGISISKD